MENIISNLWQYKIKEKKMQFLFWKSDSEVVDLNITKLIGNNGNEMMNHFLLKMKMVWMRGRSRCNGSIRKWGELCSTSDINAVI